MSFWGKLTGATGATGSSDVEELPPGSNGSYDTSNMGSTTYSIGVTGSYPGLTSTGSTIWTNTTGGGGGGLWTNTTGTTGPTYGVGTGTIYPSNTITISGNKPILSTDKNNINLDELAEMMKIMRERFLIIVPDFEKHEKYEALKKAYDHYKLMEALVTGDKK
jgi:hypothetical protein